MSSPSLSRAAAIDAKCRDCIYDELSPGSWRDQVAACTISDCPLYAFRPVPAACMAGRFVDEVACAAVRSRLTARN